MEMDDRIIVELGRRSGRAKGRGCTFCYLVRCLLGLVGFV